MASALCSLLSSWQRRRDATVADQLDDASDRSASAEPPMHASAWWARPLDLARLPSLFAALPPVGDPSLGRCLDRLWSIPVDPRIATALQRLVLQELPRSDDLAFWNRALALLAWVADVRTVDWLGPLLGDVNGPALATRQLVLRANELIVWLGGQPRDVGHARGGVVTELTIPPADPIARLVFADELLTRGDVRGELIMLQRLEAPRRDQRRHLADLLRCYGPALLGRLRPALKPQGLRIRDGVVVGGRLSGYRALRPLLDASEWRHIEELDLRELHRRWPRGSTLMELLERLTRLRVVHHFPATELRALSAWQTPTSIRELHVVGWAPGVELAELRVRPALPALERLTHNGNVVPRA
jgi:hypothetical protein